LGEETLEEKVHGLRGHLEEYILKKTFDNGKKGKNLPNEVVSFNSTNAAAVFWVPKRAARKKLRTNVKEKNQ